MVLESELDEVDEEEDDDVDCTSGTLKFEEVNESETGTMSAGSKPRLDSGGRVPSWCESKSW